MKSLMILSLALAITYGKLDILETMKTLEPNPCCSTLDMRELVKCLYEFETELSNDDKQFQVIQTRTKCCSLTHLRKCALDVIGDHWGDKTEQVLNFVMKMAIENIKDHIKCENYDGFVATVICLPGN